MDDIKAAFPTVVTILTLKLDMGLFAFGQSYRTVVRQRLRCLGWTCPGLGGID
jgi:hypothetical protein